MTRSVQPVNSVKKPCQQRSRDSLERILKSAEALIRSKGHEALTIAEVVRHSHTSIGTFYARFPDKTALLHAVHERVLSRHEEELEARLAEVDWQTLSLEETIRRLAVIKGDWAKGTEKLFAAFVVSGATDNVVRERGYRSKAIEEELEVAILMQHADEIAGERPERAIRIACRLWQAAQEENVYRLRSGVPGPGGVPQDAVMEEIAGVVIAYLKGAGITACDDGVVEAVASDDGPNIDLNGTLQP